MLKQLLRSLLMVVLLALVCTTLPTAQADPGDLDKTFAGFGDEGIVTTEEMSPEGMVFQPDGRVLVVSNSGDVTVRRYTPDGYGDAEYVIPDPFQTHFVAHDIALQADGKIVVAGQAERPNTSHSFMLARLAETGHLDPSFGQGGYAVTDFGKNLEEVAYKVLIQPDGKIVAAGYAHVNGESISDADFAVVRYTPKGDPDTTFGGGDGIVTVDFGSSDRACDIALQADGKLVVTGETLQYRGFPDNSSDYDFGLVRLEADGSLDDNSNGDGGFRGNGRFSQNFGGNERFAQGVALQPDGKIVVAGEDTYANRSIVARFLPNGALDESGFNGWYFAPVGSHITNLALQPDGKIMAIGSLSRDLALLRLKPTGTLDASFDNDGIKTIDFGGDDYGKDVALLPDGRILGLGESNSSSFRHALKLARLWPDGTADSGGQQTHAIAPGLHELGYALAVQTDGSLLVAGEVNRPNNAPSSAFVTRFHSDGRVDTGFGPSGRGTIQTVTIGSTTGGARAIALQADGKIVIAGHRKGVVSSSTEDFLVARWNSNGTVDDNFGVVGFRMVPFPGNGDDYATALAVAPNGKIVVAGNVWNGTRQVWGVARLTSTGDPDSTFDGDGLFTFGLSGSNAVNALAVQPDGKILVAGHIGGDFAVARLMDNGSFDPGFGQGGFAINHLGGAEVINALVLASNGWIYAAGSRALNGKENMALAQYTPQGVLASCPDPANCYNWPSGTLFVNTNSNDNAFALDLRSDNQLVAAGCINDHFAAVQVRTDGGPVPLPFNTDFVGIKDCARAVKFIGTSTMVLAGSQNLTPISTDWNIALARFTTTVAGTTPPPAPTPNPGPTGHTVYLPLILH